MTDTPDLEAALGEIRTEYERSISDAYAGGPRARDHAWKRLEPLIESYAAKYAATHPQPTPTMATNTGTTGQNTRTRRPNK